MSIDIPPTFATLVPSDRDLGEGGRRRSFTPIQLMLDEPLVLKLWRFQVLRALDQGRDEFEIGQPWLQPDEIEG